MVTQRRGATPTGTTAASTHTEAASESVTRKMCRKASWDLVMTALSAATTDARTSPLVSRRFSILAPYQAISMPIVTSIRNGTTELALASAANTISRTPGWE